MSERNWGECYLIRRYPEHLSGDIDPMGLSAFFKETDIRYHEKRTEILKKSGINISVPYTKLLSKDRLEKYMKAISV